jgi:hypothetical protein
VPKLLLLLLLKNRPMCWHGPVQTLTADLNLH